MIGYIEIQKNPYDPRETTNAKSVFDPPTDAQGERTKLLDNVKKLADGEPAPARPNIVPLHKAR